MPGASGSTHQAGTLRFMIHKHDARTLHYDVRLELDGALKSWAVPKGPSLDPKDKRLAIQVEDHAMGYATFEGRIPPGHYGAGQVIVWDQGTWHPHDDPTAGYASGRLDFTLVGEKLSGDWALVRTRIRGRGEQPQWLLIKARDASARLSSDCDILAERPRSVISGGLLDRDRVPGAAARKKTPVCRERARPPVAGPQDRRGPETADSE